MRYLRYLKHLIIVAFIALYCSMSSCNYLNVLLCGTMMSIRVRNLCWEI